MSRLSTINNRVRRAIDSQIQSSKKAEVYVVSREDYDRWKSQGLYKPERALVLILQKAPAGQ